MDTDTRQIHNFQAGDLFDRHYRLLEHVGSGGFADVWKAKDELVDTIVALKIYTRLDKEGISELAKEYKEMRGIKHPNLLTGNHFDASGNIPYLEMDYCDGGSLYGRMGKMSNEELLHVLRDIAGGLAYLHREGIVHQDIKPENILYDTKKNRYLLSDFGISGKSRTRLSHSVNKANMTFSMTEAYAPPEKFSGNLADIEPDTKGDIFSLGMTLYELTIGQLPFSPPMATGREMLLQRGQLQLDYSQIKDPQLRKIVEGCTRYRKEERLTAKDVLSMLEDDILLRQPYAAACSPSLGEQKKTGKSPTVEIKMNGGKSQTSEVLESQEQHKANPALNHKWIYLTVTVLAVVLGILALTHFRPATDSLSGNVDSVEQENNFNVYMDGDDIVYSYDGTEYRYKMVYVNGGTYSMGCTSDDCRLYPDAKPVHNVTVENFFLGQTEVTQSLWIAVMNSNPSYWRGNTLPVECVTYYDVKEFIHKLNFLTKKNFRLPTEEEWEYAARGGNRSKGYKYSGSNDIERVAWYEGNSNLENHPVAQKQGNELGIYDMSGNVMEMCSSLGSDDYNSARWDSTYVVRNGCNGSLNLACVVWNRNYLSQSDCDLELLQGIGFRLTLSAR